jgi:hypothetical protein
MRFSFREKADREAVHEGPPWMSSVDGLMEIGVRSSLPGGATAARRIAVLASNGSSPSGSCSGATVATLKAIADRLDAPITDVKTDPPDSDKWVDLADDPSVRVRHGLVKRRRRRRRGQPTCVVGVVPR